MRITIVGARIGGITLIGLGELANALGDALPDDGHEMYFWSLLDVRSARWVRGRVALLGDAAAGFLPTVGVGASMAMEPAAVLDDELSRADSGACSARSSSMSGAANSGLNASTTTPASSPA